MPKSRLDPARSIRSPCLLALLGLLVALPPQWAIAQAQATAGDNDGQEAAETQAPPPDGEVYERIMVIGDPANLDLIPGSATYLGGFQLREAKTGFDDIHRMLARVPGVHFQEEEGFGLRPNIGLRGSGAERSSRITLMEDGVLIAPAPYAAPAAYYFPTAGRMEAIEVRKGSSQVKYGPRTTGGAINLVSTRVPSTFSVVGNVALGSDSTGKGHLAIGGASGRWGWLLETYQLQTEGFKHVDGGGEAGFALRDYMGKLRYRTDATSTRFQELELKLGYTDQASDETYLGLTEADFRADPYRRYAGSQLDNIRSEHRQLQLRHFAELGDSADLTSVAYRNDFKRDWYKLDSISGAKIADVLGSPDRYADELAILRGADSAADALVQRHNNRDYYSHGIQTVLGLRLAGDRVRHELELGIRYHEDQEDRFQSEDGYRMLGGQKVLTSIGAPGSQANRVADARAWALFAQNRLRIGALSITPGIRVESISLRRIDYAKTDPSRTAPTRIREATFDVVVPGVGADYRLGNTTSLFAGIHRGFAPPGPGSSEMVDPETSVNYEIGARYRIGETSLQVAGFYNDYGNLLGSDTLSSGGTGTGDQFNGGAARVYGVELAARHDLSDLFGVRTSDLPIGVTYTWTRGEFLTAFESDFDPWGRVATGDELPYLPEHQLFLTAGFRRAAWDVVLEGIVGSAMRTSAGQGPLSVTDSTDSHGVLNLSAGVRLTDRVRLQGSVQNLLDEAYVVARRPAGARPGLPRTLVLGLRLLR